MGRNAGKAVSYRSAMSRNKLKRLRANIVSIRDVGMVGRPEPHDSRPPIDRLRDGDLPGVGSAAEGAFDYA
jgi:hypothetical protein